MPGLRLDHREPGRARGAVRTEDEEEVRKPRDGRAFVGLVAVLEPELPELRAAPADDLERWRVSLLEDLEARREDQEVELVEHAVADVNPRGRHLGKGVGDERDVVTAQRRVIGVREARTLAAEAVARGELRAKREVRHLALEVPPA